MLFKYLQPEHGEPREILCPSLFISVSIFNQEFFVQLLQLPQLSSLKN